MRLFSFEGNPLLLPWFVCDIFLVYELCRQYGMWSFFFDKKRKWQCIPIPFNIFDITAKISSSLTKMIRFFEYLI
jgi:hypothetical protein